MAILEQSKTYIDGVDIVKGQDITDTQDTAINANRNATSAVETANTASADAQNAITIADGAVINSNSAEILARTALNKANEAIDKIPTFTYDESTKTLNIVTGG